MVRTARAFVVLLAVWCGLAAVRPVAGSSRVDPAAVPDPIPARIVSTSPSVTETLFALGLGDHVVGVSTFCRFPPEVLKLPKVGTFLNPDAERVAALRPDLVALDTKGNGLDRRLAALHIRFVAVADGTLATVYSSIRQIAAAANVAPRGEALVASIQQRLDAIHRASAGAPATRVLFIIGRRPGELADLVGVGPGSYLNDLIEIAGGTNVLNIAGQPEYPRISMEAVLRLDPDVIVDTVDMGDTDLERERRRPINERLWTAYPTLTAVRTAHVHAATTDALVVPGPRVVDAAEWVASLLGRRHGR